MSAASVPGGALCRRSGVRGPAGLCACAGPSAGNPGVRRLALFPRQIFMSCPATAVVEVVRGLSGTSYEVKRYGVPLGCTRHCCPSLRLWLRCPAAVASLSGNPPSGDNAMHGELDVPLNKSQVLTVDRPFAKAMSVTRMSLTCCRY